MNLKASKRVKYALNSNMGSGAYLEAKGGDSLNARIISDILERFGVRGVFKGLSAISWFIFPFLIWIGVYRFVGASYFVTSWLTILGLVILLILISFYLYEIVSINTLDKKLMKRIEYAKNVFSNPADSDSEKKFKFECQRFMMPYLNYGALVTSGASRFFGASDFHRTRIIVQVVFTLFFSYSVMVFLISNQTYFSQVYSHVVSNIPILYPPLNYFIGFVNAYLVISIGLLLSLSLYYDPSLKMARTPYLKISKSSVAADFCINLVSVFLRIFLLACYVIIAPIKLMRRENRLKYTTFGYPMHISLAIQNAVRGAEGKKCVTSTFSYTPKDGKDIKNLINEFLHLREFPVIIKFFIRMSNPNETQKIIKTIEPVLYLGTIDNRCAVLGNVRYDPYKRTRTAEFFFDNRNVKDEFKRIIDIEINEQRKLKEGLPPNLEEIIAKLESNKNGPRD